MDPGRYCGIEPDRDMVEFGVRTFLEPGLAETKVPRFDYNTDFDAGVFGESFDFFLARSVWSHASKGQIRQMLESFERHGAEGALFLSSYRSAEGRKDYTGEEWVGQSHTSEEPGSIAHRFQWIREECARHGMQARELSIDVYKGQRWVTVQKGARPADSWLTHLQDPAVDSAPRSGLQRLLRRRSGRRR